MCGCIARQPVDGQMGEEESQNMRHYPSKSSEWASFGIELTDDELLIGGWQVMQRWEEPLMRVLAAEVTKHRGDILEVGFGMGISARAIVDCGCDSYTVIEAHPVVADAARAWGEQPAVPVTVIEGFWEDVVPDLQKRFDGILFDTYPLSEQERSRNHYPFIGKARPLLNAGGRLAVYSDETTDFRPEHLKLWLENFDEVRLVKVEGLEPPADCEYWSTSTMVIPVGVVGPNSTNGSALPGGLRRAH